LIQQIEDDQSVNRDHLNDYLEMLKRI
jgi:hypothetical protein